MKWEKMKRTDVADPPNGALTFARSEIGDEKPTTQPKKPARVMKKVLWKRRETEGKGDHHRGEDNGGRPLSLWG